MANKTQNNYLQKRVVNLLTVSGLVLLGFGNAFAQEKTTVPDKVAAPVVPDKSAAPGKDTTTTAAEKKPVPAAERITIKDAKAINFDVTATLNSLQTLLTLIDDPNNTASDFKDLFDGSVNPGSANRIFYNNNINVEDDVDPQAGFGNSRDVTLDKYLNNFDVQYEKSADPTITFSNVVPSFIKQKDYLYITVNYDSKFAGLNRISKAIYPLRQRHITFRLEKTNNQWRALIDGISFVDPSKLTDTTNNIQLYTDTSANAGIISQSNIAGELSSYMTKQQEEEKAKQAQFDEYITTAANYANDKHFDEALEFLNKAKSLKTLVPPSLDKKIADTKILAALYTYDVFKLKGDKAKDERRYDLAIQYYQQALKLKPPANTTVGDTIKKLNAQLTLLEPFKTKLAQGLFKDDRDDCEKKLRENKQHKGDFPELYYIMAKAYEGMAAAAAGDNKSLLASALENYKQAIAYCPGYVEAHIDRSRFLIRFMQDYSSATEDYNALIRNTDDDAPEKPGYFIERAKIKDNGKNYASAVEDYTSAIALNKNTPSIYFDRGELLYRLKNFSEAQKNFDIALKLDSKYKNAYYYRGLNFVSQKNYVNAGADFTETEKLGFEPAQKTKVDSISNAFFLEGQALLSAHKFLNADSAFDKALKIRNCNANALHGKAEMRLISGDELTAKKNTDAATPMYNESIALNRQAIACSPAFYDVHYKEGLAHYKIKEYNLALASYTNATKSDIDDIKIKAFIERGNTYQTLKKYQPAAEDYGQALIVLQANLEAAKKGSDKTLVKKFNDNLSLANQLKGQALYYAGDYVNSISASNNAIDLLQTNNEAYYYRGLAYFEQNELSKSARDFDEAIKVDPQYKYYYANGKANFKNQRYQAAVNNFSDAIRTDSTYTLKNKYYLRGLSYFKLKQYADAIADFDLYHKVENSKTDTSFYVDYGTAQLFAGQDNAASESFKYALNMSPKNAKALYGLGCYYAKTNQLDKVDELIQNAFASKSLTRDDIRLQEDAFLTEYLKVKANKTKYNDLKKAAFSSGN